jgi:hypothetical protein
MKRFIYTIAAASMMFTGCVKDDNIPEPKPEPVESALVLNEIMSKDVDGNPDWIEVYNGSDKDMDISGYILNDKAVSEGGFSIPSGTIIASKGFYLVDANESGVKVGSGGEDVSLSDATGVVIDYTKTPDMSSDAGLTWARMTDGGDPWKISSPTPGVTNGTGKNEAPIIGAQPLTELDNIYSVTASDADGIASVKLIKMVNNGVLSYDMALVDGKYTTSVSLDKVGDVVKYVVKATDNTGLISYYPEGGFDTPGEYTVIGGFEEVTFNGTDAGNRGDVTFSAKTYFPMQVKEVRLYYFLPGETQDDKKKVVLTNVDGVWEGDIPAQNTNDVVSYYLRVEYEVGTKTYYPMETEEGDFDHDDGTTWPTYTVEEKNYAPVTGKVVTYTEGPLTKVTFPENPIPGTDINVELEYSSSDVIAEARIYFDVGENPVYVKGNKIKGEDEGSFTQTGVTINFAGEVADNGLAVDAEGAKVSFYVRIAVEDASGNALAEYYYGNDGSRYVDNTPGGGTTDQSDAFKGDPSLWNVYNVQ